MLSASRHGTRWGRNPMTPLHGCILLPSQYPIKAFDLQVLEQINRRWTFIRKYLQWVQIIACHNEMLEPLEEEEPPKQLNKSFTEETEAVSIFHQLNI